MKKLLLIPILFFTVFAAAQTALPYFIGFNSFQEFETWSLLRKGDNTTDNWDLEGLNSYSSFSIYHDVPIGASSTTDDWIVSPQFNFSNGALIDSIRYYFGGLDQPGTNDTIAIYLLNGSPDPTLASSIILLKDYRGANAPLDFTWKIDTNIVVPAIGGQSYIAIRYLGTPSIGTYVMFDNIAISANTTGIIGPTGSPNIEVFPNPANDKLNIRMASGKDHTIEIYNISGQWLGSRELRSGEGSISLRDIEKGMVIVKIFNEEVVYFKKILIQ